MTETFAWRVTGQPTGTGTFAVIAAKFGDGYSQEAQDGINNETQSWPVQFTGTKEQSLEIITFFRRHGGATGFFWTTPLGEEGLYKVASYTSGYQGGDVWVVSATFEQKFAP